MQAEVILCETSKANKEEGESSDPKSEVEADSIVRLQGLLSKE
jgi:hypothetical protein